MTSSFLSLLLLGPAQTAPSPEPPVLRIGMDTRTPPWAFVPGLDFSKEDLLQPPRPSASQLAALDGFDPALAGALARQLGMTARIVPVSWFRIERGLLAGDYDVILSSWTPNPRTPPGLAASISYCDWGLVVAVRAGEAAIRSPADLAGRRVGHMRDPAVSAALGEMGGGSFVQDEDPEKLFARLKAGKLDAVILDSFYVRWKVSQDRAFRVVGEPLNRLGYHVGVRSEDQILLGNVNRALRVLLDSGELAALRERWEGPPQGRRP